MAKPRKKPKPARPLLAGAFFCEKILEEKDNVHSAIRIVDILNIPKPTDLPVASEGPSQHEVVTPIMAFLAFKSGKAEGAYTLRVVVVKPSGRRVKVAEMPVTFLGAENGVVIRLTMIVSVKEEGLYWYEVRLNGSLATRMPLRIVHVVSKPDAGQSEPSPESEEKR